MTNDTALVWYGNHEITFFIQLALAGEAAVVARVAGSVYVIFLPVAHFRQQVFALLNVHMAGTASANATAVVVELNIIVQRHFKYALTGLYVELLFGAVLLFKSESNLTHCVSAAKVQLQRGNARKETKVRCGPPFLMIPPANPFENTNFAHLLTCS